MNKSINELRAIYSVNIHLKLFDNIKTIKLSN